MTDKAVTIETRTDKVSLVSRTGLVGSRSTGIPVRVGAVRVGVSKPRLSSSVRSHSEGVLLETRKENLWKASRGCWWEVEGGVGRKEEEEEGKKRKRREKFSQNNRDRD